MKLLHVTPTYLPAVRYGGPVYSVHGLCKALARRGHTVEVFTTNVDGPGTSDVPLGVPVDLEGVRISYHACGMLRRLYFSQSLTAALVRRIGEFDLVHLHSVFLWPTLAGARIARRRNVPYFVSPRGMLVRSLVERKSRWLKTAWITLFERQTLSGAAGIHLTSAVEKRDLAEFPVDLARAFIEPNGIDPGDAPEPDRRDPSTLLFLGRLNWKKGLDRLIPALREVPTARVIVAGNDEEGYERELRELAERHQVASRVEFIGHAGDARKKALLRSATALVLPSYSENFGNAVLEAMSEGCPVVVTAEVGLADEIERAEAGLICSGNPEALAGALRALLADRPRQRALARNAYNLVRERFDWSTVAASMERHYGRAIGPR